MKQLECTMCVVWLVANQCYAVAFGESLISIGDQFLFSKRMDLETALRRSGLRCGDFEGDGIITMEKEQ